MGCLGTPRGLRRRQLGGSGGYARVGRAHRNAAGAPPRCVPRSRVRPPGCHPHHPTASFQRQRRWRGGPRLATVRRDGLSQPAPADRGVLPLGLDCSLNPGASRIPGPYLARNLRTLGSVWPWVLKFRPRSRTSRPTPLSGVLFSSSFLRTEPRARLSSRILCEIWCLSSHFSRDPCMRH